jgi:hypothetical protein
MKHLYKANMKSPAKVAEYCAVHYPAVITNGDTIVKVEYDFIEVECPPVQKPDWVLQKDSAGRYSKQGVITYKKATKRGIVRTDTITKVKVKVERVEKVVTKYVRDSAAVAQYKSLYDNCVQSSILSNDKMEKKNQWIKWLLIALACSIILNVLFITNHK